MFPRYARLLITTVALAASAATAKAQAPAIPDSPAGAVVKAYLTAVTSGRDADIAAFVRLAAEDPADAQERAMRTQRTKGIASGSGGFTLLAIERVDASGFVGRVKSGKGEELRLSMEFGKRPDGTLFVDGVSLEPVK